MNKSYELSEQLRGEVQLIGKKRGHLEIKLAGLIDEPGWEALETFVSRKIDAGTRWVVLDFEKTTLDPSAVGMGRLARIHQHSQRSGGGLGLARLSPSVKSTFLILGFGAIIPYFDSVSEAHDGILLEPVVILGEGTLDNHFLSGVVKPKLLEGRVHQIWDLSSTLTIDPQASWLDVAKGFRLRMGLVVLLGASSSTI